MSSSCWCIEVYSFHFFLLFVCMVGEGFSFLYCAVYASLVPGWIPEWAKLGWPASERWVGIFFVFSDIWHLLNFSLLLCFPVKQACVSVMDILYWKLFTCKAALNSFTESLISWELFYFTFPLCLLSIIALFFETGFKTCILSSFLNVSSRLRFPSSGVWLFCDYRLLS